MQHRRRITLNEGADTQRHYYALAAVETGPGAGLRSIEQLARPIDANHSLFGKVRLNAETFRSFVRNFEANTLGQEIYLDRNHNPGDGVNGVFRGLQVDRQGRLLGDLEWKPLGVKTFTEDGFKYFSIDFTDDFVHPETGKSHGPLLFGAGLVPRPFIKNMTPSAGPGRLMLSDQGRSVFVPYHLRLEDCDMKKYLEALRAKLLSLKLSNAMVATLLAQFEAQAIALGLGDDEGKLHKLGETFEATATQLAAGESNVTLTVNGGLTADAISTAVAKALADAETRRVTLAQTAETHRKTFTDAINAAQGLSEVTRASLRKQAAAITAEMTAEQVKTLADAAIEIGNATEVTLRRAQLGFGGTMTGVLPNVMLTSDIGTQAHGLMREHLQFSAANAGLRLPEEKQLTSFARKVLAEFDRLHGARLDAEVKRLAGDGSTNVADSQFPVVAQRQVIIELLADLRFLQMVQTIVDPQAQATMQIPYEQRNTGQVTNGAVVYEGNPIPYGGVRQLMDQAYVVPRKIAMLMSNELIHFTQRALINWDAWARNIASNARLMRDIIATAVANEMQRSADAFGAGTVTSETITAQVNGTRTTFKTAQFPVVRPRTVRDLQGNAIGTEQNAITLTISGTPRPMYDGTGTQGAGNYWRFTDWNLGYFQIVNQAGAVQTLANATAVVISYSNSTNRSLFDLDIPGGVASFRDHANTLLDIIGRRKAILSQERFVQAQFLVCAATLHNTITEATQFERDQQKDGTNLDVRGDLANVKGLPAFGTNQPGIDLGESRILMGESNVCSYGIAKPFVTGTPFEVMDPTTMRPTGEKQAYGEEYSTIHVPLPLRGRLTSVIVYSATARAAV